jgi:ankyrin repeat protein
MAAAQSGAPSLIAELLTYHPNVNAQDGLGRTSAHLVSEEPYRFYWSDGDRAKHQEQRAQIILMLAQAGANLDLPDREGNTPLHDASVERIAEALIKSGANINIRNDRGKTPHMTTDSAAVARLLIQAGADITARDNTGHTALELARSNEFLGDKVEIRSLCRAVRESFLKSSQQFGYSEMRGSSPGCRMAHVIFGEIH